MSEHANSGQAEYWSGAAGLKWIDHEAILDATLAPVRDRILDLANLASDARVLDIGCGTGDLTIEAAKRCPLGMATGADISAPLLQRAHARSTPENVRFLQCDAQTEDFRGAYTHVVSRLGLMFFADPVAALSNIARAIPEGGMMSFAAWASAAKSVWFSTPKAAAEARLGPGPTRDPKAPGPLAFQDLDYVVGLLSQAGWQEIEATAEAIHLTPGADLSRIAPVATRVGPAARIFAHHGGSDADLEAIVDDVAEEFAQFQTEDGLRLPSTLNFVRCRAPGL